MYSPDQSHQGVIFWHGKVMDELGRKGGRASAEKLTDEERRERARKAAQARWVKKRK